MDRYARLLLGLILVGATAACAPATDEPAASTDPVAPATAAAAIAGQFPDQVPTGPIPSDTAMDAPVDGVSPLALIGLAVVLLVGLTVTRRAVEIRSRG